MEGDRFGHSHGDKNEYYVVRVFNVLNWFKDDYNGKPGIIDT